jgi:arsenate reductase (glutaredoxin)
MEVIYNPKCSKCRTLEKELDTHQLNWEKLTYLETGLSSERIAELFDQYEGDWRNLVRDKESVFTEAGLNPKEMSREDMMAFLVEHPIAIQRPIVIKGKQIIIARDEAGIKQAIN